MKITEKEKEEGMEKTEREQIKNELKEERATKKKDTDIRKKRMTQVAWVLSERTSARPVNSQTDNIALYTQSVQSLNHI
jgi:endonuclease III